MAHVSDTNPIAYLKDLILKDNMYRMGDFWSASLAYPHRTLTGYHMNHLGQNMQMGGYS